MQRSERALMLLLRISPIMFVKGFNDKDNSLLFLAVHLITFVICEVNVSCSSTLFLVFIMSDMNIADQSNIHLQDLKFVSPCIIIQFK